MFELIGDLSWGVMYEARGFRIGRAGSSKYVILFFLLDSWIGHRF